MPNLTTTQESTRSPIDGTEYMRMATGGTNWKGQLSAQWAFGGAIVSDALSAGLDPAATFAILVPDLQVIGTAASPGFGMGTYSNSGSVHNLVQLLKSRGTVVGAHGVLPGSETIGRIIFEGSDGFSFQQSSEIRGNIDDASPTSGSMPGRLQFFTASSGSTTPYERMRIDSVGGVTLNPGGAANTYGALTIIDNQGVNMIQLTRITVDTGYPTFLFYKARGTGVSADVINDGLGGIQFNGADGFNGLQAALISVSIDATVTSNSVPGRLSFFTTSTNAGNSTTERMRIDSTGRVTVGGGANAAFTVFEVRNDVNLINNSSIIGYGAGSANAPILGFFKTRGADATTSALIQNGDSLGGFQFSGADNAGYNAAAQILVAADGTPTSGSCPARIVISTTSTNAATYTERMRIDSGGRVSIGPFGTGALNQRFEIDQDPTLLNHFGLGAYGANSTPINFGFFKSRTVGSAPSALNVLLSGDQIGIINWYGADGQNFRQSAAILSITEGTPTSGNVPGSLYFYTTPSTTGGATAERMRIDSAGRVNIGDAVGSQGGALFQLVVNPVTQTAFDIYSFGANGSSIAINLVKTRGATTPTTTDVLSNGDGLGTLNFWGTTGAGFAQAAIITAVADAAPSASSMPGRLSFFTTTSASVTPTEVMRIDSSQRVAIGGATGSSSGKLQLIATGATDLLFDCYSVGNSASPASIQFRKTRGTTFGVFTVGQSGDVISNLLFSGTDGAAYQSAAQIQAVIDATPSASSMPGRLAFYTTTSSSVTVTERMRIDATGYITTGAAANQQIGNHLGTQQNVGIEANGTTGALATMAAIRWSADGNSSRVMLAKSRGATVGTQTVLQAADALGILEFNGSTGIQFNSAAYIAGVADLAFSSGSCPGQLSFATSTSGSVTPTERLRIDRTGAVFFPSVGTTGSAASAYLNSASSPANQLLRSTSSVRYKGDIAPVLPSRIAAAAALRPIEFTSTAPNDLGVDTRFVGLVAEEVYQADPALAFLDDQGRPDGVMYDRVLLLQVEALKQRIEQLEQQLATRH